MAVDLRGALPEPDDLNRRQKRVLRQRFRQHRRLLSALQVAFAEAAVWDRLRQFASFHRAEAVVSYVACENEVGTGLIHADLAANQRTIFLPAADAPAFCQWRAGEPLTPGVGATCAAVGDLLLADIHAIFLVPLVAWNKRGTRLGRGKGFYDRAIAQARANETLIVGLGYEFQECEDLPKDPWDVPMNYILTERRVVRACRKNHD